MGIELIHRDIKSIKIKLTSVDVVESYKILACFPFSSETKRMGIILKHKESNRIIFFLKGAETVMIDKLKPHQRITVEEQVDTLASKGLRTLVLSGKVLPLAYYRDWKLRYKEAQS